MPKAQVIECRLNWSTQSGTTVYVLWGLDDNDQLSWLGDFEQGQFDTALEVAQWAWRLMARHVVPSAL